ncbi:MAG: hypothetical protein ACKO3H_05145 [Verrucomicrobiota bacterium]
MGGQANLELLAVTVLWALALLPVPVRGADFQGSTHLVPFEEDNIQYGKTVATGPIQKLQERLEAGQATLEWDERFGYLRSILGALKVPEASQMLVFSKTSFQRDRISPANPRAIYFNEDVYVGYVPGSPVLEFSMADPKLGGVFYTVDNRRTNRVRFVRTDNCLECHAGAKTMGVPGHLIRSFATDENGVQDLLSGGEVITHRTPLAERWGGWFVTGQHGSQTHRGNLVGSGDHARQLKEPNFVGNKTTLTDIPSPFDVGRYPKGTSDIVALMVMEHQAHLHNFLTRLQYEATIQLKAYGHCNYIKSPLEAFLRYLLFTEETPLTAPVSGSPELLGAFQNEGVRDSKGRSLREFDLKQRMFRYPCSYLIHSEAFRALPVELKSRIYHRLWAILTCEDESPEWASLSRADRRAVLEILTETIPDLPAYWKL